MLFHCLTKLQGAEYHPDPLSPVVKMASVGRQSVVGRVQPVFGRARKVFATFSWLCSLGAPRQQEHHLCMFMNKKLRINEGSRLQRDKTSCTADIYTDINVATAVTSGELVSRYMMSSVCVSFLPQLAPTVTGYTKDPSGEEVKASAADRNRGSCSK